MLAEWAPVVLLHPQTHAAMMKTVVAFAPNDHTCSVFTLDVLLGFRLTAQTGIHYLNSTNGADLAFNIPGPHRNRVPLLQSEHLIWFRRIGIVFVRLIVVISHLKQFHFIRNLNVPESDAMRTNTYNRITSYNASSAYNEV